MISIPVKYKGKVLMPMKASRVRRFIKLGKGKLRYNRKLGLHYLQLLVEPSGEILSEVILGIDPGSQFDGFSIVSGNKHLGNWELIQRAKKIWKGNNSNPHPKSIEQALCNRSGMRRIRRSRLWHRKARFNNRTSSKLAPTHQAQINFRIYLINNLVKYFPITKVIVEDVRFNHYASNKGVSFSNVELGKTKFYSYLSNLFKLELVDGWTTHQLRINSFGVDPKLSDKGSKDFNAHCVDSFVLACNKGYKVDLETGEVIEPLIVFKGLINKRVIFVSKMDRRPPNNGKARVLHLAGKNLRCDSWRGGPYLIIHGKGGKIIIKRNQLSNKYNKCRVKINDSISNHGPWEYINNGRAERRKQYSYTRTFSNRIGGSTRIKNGKSILLNKCKESGEWFNTEVELL